MVMQQRIGQGDIARGKKLFGCIPMQESCASYGVCTCIDGIVKCSVCETW